MKKVIVRIKGGLGNQLFCYSAARRLAILNDAELVIDDVSGFVRDYQYQRKYELNNFNIEAKKATEKDLLEPFGRYRRALFKLSSKFLPFEKRGYIEQENSDFDKRLLELKFNKVIYLDGYWQSELYFKDIENIIRNDLRIVKPKDEKNRLLAEAIKGSNSVGLHIRWFDQPKIVGGHNLSFNYYKKAIQLIEDKLDSPHYFVFSDDYEAVKEYFTFLKGRVTFVNCNDNDNKAYADLWLMSLCKHFIMANSTFSWWGAWLGNQSNRTIIVPDINLNGKTSWGFNGLIPDRWVKIKV